MEYTEQEKAELLSKARSQHDINWMERCFADPIPEIVMMYRFKRAKGKWPDQIFVYYVGHVDSRWLRKIYSLIDIGKRPGNREECISNHLAYRCKFLIYNNWEGLIEDEELCGSDPAFIAALKEQSLKYPIKQLNSIQ